MRVLVIQNQKTFLTHLTFLSDTNTLINLCDLVHNLSLPLPLLSVFFMFFFHFFISLSFCPTTSLCHISHPLWLLSGLLFLILHLSCLFFPVLSYRFVFLFLFQDWAKQLFILMTWLAGLDEHSPPQTIISNMTYFFHTLFQFISASFADSEFMFVKSEMLHWDFSSCVDTFFWNMNWISLLWFWLVALLRVIQFILILTFLPPNSCSSIINQSTGMTSEVILLWHSSVLIPDQFFHRCCAVWTNEVILRSGYKWKP